MSGLGPDQLRENALEDYRKHVVRIQDELESMIKMFSFMRGALETEMMSGLGYKQMSADDKLVKKLKDLTLGMEKLVDAKVKFDKAMKGLAESMTPEEELKAVEAHIKALPHAERTVWLRTMAYWHADKEMRDEKAKPGEAIAAKIS